MYRSVILPLAELDISEAAAWYEERQAGLAKKFLFQVRRKLALIEQNPYMFAIRYDDIHTAVLDVFPFMIHYRIGHNPKTVTIAAVLHMSRDPDIWKRF